MIEYNYKLKTLKKNLRWWIYTSTRHFLIPFYHIIKTEIIVVNNLSSDAKKKTLLNSHSLDIVPIMTLQLMLEPNIRKGYRFIFFRILTMPINSGIEYWHSSFPSKNLQSFAKSSESCFRPSTSVRGFLLKVATSIKLTHAFTMVLASAALYDLAQHNNDDT